MTLSNEQPGPARPGERGRGGLSRTFSGHDGRRRRYAGRLRRQGATVALRRPHQTAKSATSAPSDPNDAGRRASGDAFYTPPSPLPCWQPGRHHLDAIRPAPAGAQAWKVLYHSRAVDGTDIAVSGYVIAPRPRRLRRVPRAAWAQARPASRTNAHRPAPARPATMFPTSPTSSPAATSSLPPITKGWARRRPPVRGRRERSTRAAR